MGNITAYITRMYAVVIWYYRIDFVANFIRFPECKSFENRLRFENVTESLKVGTFLRHSVNVNRTIFHLCSYFLPERDYVTFGSLLSQFRLSIVCNVGAPYSGG